MMLVVEAEFATMLLWTGHATDIMVCGFAELSRRLQMSTAA